MPRPLRIQYPGAVYHIMARGNHGQPIYKDDKDRQRFLESLAEACEETGWRVYKWVGPRKMTDLYYGVTCLNKRQIGLKFYSTVFLMA